MLADQTHFEIIFDVTFTALISLCFFSTCQYFVNVNQCGCVSVCEVLFLFCFVLSINAALYCIFLVCEDFQEDS